MVIQANTLFANRYQLIRLLGRGGFSEVWLANDSYTHLDVAIKIYAPGQGMEADGLVEFSAELAKVFNLNHVNLLKPSHVDTWEGMPYLIMPYCSQGSITKEVGKMKEPEIWQLIRDVACGLAYLHEHDIVHQDIKPDNILLDDNGNYVITDFGISAKARSTLRKSVIGGVVSGGTTAYMGPERFSKNPTPTKASDIWSFGAMVYELLTGEVPFGELGGSLQKAGAEIPKITVSISDTLSKSIEGMLANDPWSRPIANDIFEGIKSTKEFTNNIPNARNAIEQMILDEQYKTAYNLCLDCIKEGIEVEYAKTKSLELVKILKKSNQKHKIWVIIVIITTIILSCVMSVIVSLL